MSEFNSRTDDMQETRIADTEAREGFHRQADERWTRLMVTDKTVAWDAARPYLEARARGDSSATRPGATEFTR